MNVLLCFVHLSLCIYIGTCVNDLFLLTSLLTLNKFYDLYLYYFTSMLFRSSHYLLYTIK
mgnify:CR=1 FL=1